MGQKMRYSIAKACRLMQDSHLLRKLDDKSIFSKGTISIDDNCLWSPLPKRDLNQSILQIPKHRFLSLSPSTWRILLGLRLDSSLVFGLVVDE